MVNVAPNVLEELNNSMPRRITDIIKAKGVQCCCVFIGMYLKYVVVFHWNIFDTYIQLLPDYTLIWFIEGSWTHSI